jgi:Leucine rich repeat
MFSLQQNSEMLSLKPFFGIFLLFTKTTIAFHILPQFNCTFGRYGDLHTTCYNVDLKSFTFLTNINHTNVDPSTKVTTLHLTSENLYFLPRNLLKFFPDITEMKINTPLPLLLDFQSRQFQGLHSLKRVYIIGQRIRDLGANTFNGAPFITNLFLPSNQIENIHENAFTDLNHCKNLVLSANRLTSLHVKTFKHMHALWSINLSQNRLKILKQDTFAGLRFLTVIDLSFNRLKKLSSEIIEAFIKNQDPQKILALKGNLCDGGIYTQDSQNYDKLTAKCSMKDIEDCSMEEFRRLQNQNRLMRQEIEKLRNEIAEKNHERCKMLILTMKIVRELRQKESQLKFYIETLIKLVEGHEISSEDPISPQLTSKDIIIPDTNYDENSEESKEIGHHKLCHVNEKIKEEQALLIEHNQALIKVIKTIENFLKNRDKSSVKPIATKSKIEPSEENIMTNENELITTPKEEPSEQVEYSELFITNEEDLMTNEEELITTPKEEPSEQYEEIEINQLPEEKENNEETKGRRSIQLEDENELSDRKLKRRKPNGKQLSFHH